MREPRYRRKLVLEPGCYTDELLRKQGWSEPELDALARIVDVAVFAGTAGQQRPHLRAYRIGHLSRLPELQVAAQALAGLMKAPP